MPKYKRWEITAPAALKGFVIDAPTCLEARADARELIRARFQQTLPRAAALKELHLVEIPISLEHLHKSLPRVKVGSKPAAPANVSDDIPIIYEEPGPVSPNPWGIEAVKPDGLQGGLASFSDGTSGVAKIPTYPRLSDFEESAANAFRAARVSAGISLLKAAERLGLTISEVSGIETGRYKVADWTGLLAACLG